MKLILSYMKKHIKRIFGAMTIKLLGTCGELLIPYILEYIIDDIVPAKNVIKVFLWGFIMILSAFIVRNLNVGANRLAISVSRDCIRKLRYDLFKKTSNLSGSRFDAFSLPSLTSRMTSDSYNVQSFMQSVQTMGVRAPITLLGGVVVTMTMDPELSAILCIMIPILAGIVIFISRHGIPLYNKVQTSVDNIVRVMRENITGIRVVKALSKTDYEKQRFNKVNNELTGRDIKASFLMAVPGPFMQLCLNIGLTLVIIIGANRVNNGQTQPGVILAFLTYFNIILQGVMGLNRIFMQLSKATASADRIERVLLDPVDQTVIPFDPAKKKDTEDHIVFDHVSFSYSYNNELQGMSEVSSMKIKDREKCLDDVNFTIKRGDSLGIIGATGSGKTTIVNLLMRFYDADEGNIYINGRDVRTFDKDDLHRMFGVVFQNDIIFADTLHRNISFGRDVTTGQIRTAADDAMAAEFIERFEKQYEYRADIKGANLSGGQKQRILIARALAADPEILIFDDSSSALDYKTDAAFRKAVQEHHKNTTTIMIAQRISSIMNMTKIAVFEDGRIIGYGSHSELLEACPVYREIFESQMGALA